MPWTFFERFEARRDGAATAAPAVDDGDGVWTHAELFDASSRVASALLAQSLAPGDRVGLLVEPGRPWVAGLLGIWRAGGFAVPIALAHPEREIAYVLDDSGAVIVLAGDAFLERLASPAEARGVRVSRIDDALGGGPGEADPDGAAPPTVDDADPALLIYTSGTTGAPKGVVLSHGNLAAQVASLERAWGWSAGDRILEVLPLHHVHGIVNVVLTSLWAGASCRLYPRFDADVVWRAFEAEAPTLFMAVPTIYGRLIRAWDAASGDDRARYSAAARRLRLMVSGSAALPVPVLERWRELTGHTLLERYGMSEIGMALSNPLDGDRVPGSVGRPLPGVDLRIGDPSGSPLGDGQSGEVEVRGPAVFGGYWRRPEATRDAFRAGWFRTGDVAVREDGIYRLLGRSSVDILKTGGEKVSALEIEAVLREHPAIAECAVVGVADDDWGQRVAAAVELRGDAPLELEALRGWCKERLSVYKVPSRLAVVEALPRNALGKVQKPRLASLFESP
ncbi:MAG: acyl-CoA synthetase [Acidobacteriota bacterium]